MKRLLQIELVLSGGQLANVSRSDTGEILVHIHFDGHNRLIQDKLKDEAINAFRAAEKAINL
jgi:hypothetical protein